MAENGRIPGALTRRVVMVLLGALLASCSSSGGAGPATSTTSTPVPVAQASNKYPNAIVVLGHSGTTGYDSDPKAPATVARQNSWATGDNPAVNIAGLRKQAALEWRVLGLES